MTTEPPRAPLDVVVPHARTEDGDGVKVVRLREREEKVAVEVGEVRALADGRPIAPGTEVVRLAQRGEEPAYDVEVLLEAKPPAQIARKGPAQIATDAYRRNWSAIFDEASGDDEPS